MDNALFYTFSTIAQTLAAAFALLGAFVLYKLQQTSTTLAESAELVIRPYLPNEEARRLLANGLYPELEAFLKTQQQQRPEVVRHHAYAAAMSAFTTSVAARTKIMRQLSRSLVLTAAVVTGAVIALALTPVISKSVTNSIVALLAGIAALVWSLYTYSRLIWHVVK